MKFIAFDGSVIEKYHHEYKAHPDLKGYAVSYVRGVEFVEISFPESMEIRNDMVLICEESWLMTFETKYFLLSLFVFQLLFLLYKMRQAGWICKKSDDDHKLEEPNIWIYAIGQIVKMVTHNLDLFTDILYVTTVPMYSNWFKFFMILFIVIPMLLFMYFAL